MTRISYEILYGFVAFAFFGKLYKLIRGSFVDRYLKSKKYEEMELIHRLRADLIETQTEEETILIDGSKLSNEEHKTAKSCTIAEYILIGMVVITPLIDCYFAFLLEALNGKSFLYTSHLYYCIVCLVLMLTKLRTLEPDYEKYDFLTLSDFKPIMFQSRFNFILIVFYGCILFDMYKTASIKYP